LSLLVDKLRKNSYNNSVGGNSMGEALIIFGTYIFFGAVVSWVVDKVADKLEEEEEKNESRRKGHCCHCESCRHHDKDGE
jgi:uncharacterized oligopeptide transporter (OPT) family protein